jgi:outer membrane lipoprotein SlyB
MRRITVILAWLLLLGISGCAQTPQPRVEDGENFNFKTARTPYSAAICIARNAKGGPGNLTAEERLLEETSMEVIVRSRGDTLAVAQVRRDGQFSAVSIRVMASVRSDREGFARQLMADC